MPLPALPNARASRRAALLLTLGMAALPSHALTLTITPLELPGQAQGSVLATDQGFVLSWIDRENNEAALRFAELDAAGAVQRRGDITRGSGWFVNWADFPSLVMADNGDWLSFVLVKSDPAKPYAYDIHTTRSTDAGASWSAPAVLHDDGTTTEHGFVSLLPDGDDRVLAVWLDGRHTRSDAGHGSHDDHGGAHTALHSAVLTRDGISERRELDDLTCDCCRTTTVRGHSGPLVLYRDRTRAEVRDVFATQRGADGWSTPTPVHADNWVMPGCPVNGPAAAVLGSDTLVAWPTLAEGEMQLRLARGDGTRWQRLPDLDRGASLPGRVDLAPWTADSVLASWLDEADDGRTAVVLAHLGASGAVRERHVVAELPAGRTTGMPRLAARNGRAVLVWTDPKASGPTLAGVLIRAQDASASGN